MAVRKPARTWQQRGVVTAVLAMVTTTGALQPLRFANVDFTVQELEHLAAVVNGYFERRCRNGASGGGVAAQTNGTNGSADGAREISGAVMVENEVEPSILTDLYHAPSFDGAAAGHAAAGRSGGGAGAVTAAFAPGSAAAQQRDALARFSSWDSDGAAVLRAVPALATPRVRVDTVAGGLTLKLRPDVAVSTVKLLGWIVAFVVALVLLETLFIEALVSEEDAEEQHRQTYTQAQHVFRALLNGFLCGIIMLLVVYLLGLAVMAAPRHVELRVGPAGWRLASGCRGFRWATRVRFLSSVTAGETDARCGCRVRCCLRLCPRLLCQYRRATHMNASQLDSRAESVLRTARSCHDRGCQCDSQKGTRGLPKAHCDVP